MPSWAFVVVVVNLNELKIYLRLKSRTHYVYAVFFFFYHRLINSRHSSLWNLFTTSDLHCIIIQKIKERSRNQAYPEIIWQPHVGLVRGSISTEIKGSCDTVTENFPMHRQFSSWRPQLWSVSFTFRWERNLNSTQTWIFLSWFKLKNSIRSFSSFSDIC